MTAAIEQSIRTDADRIVRAWVQPDAVLGRGQGSGVAGPRVPLDGAWLTRDAITNELAYWAHAADDEGVAVVADGERLDMGSPVQTAGHLRDHARELSGWWYAETLAYDLRKLAGQIEALVRGPKLGSALGPCPVEVVTAEGDRVQCGAQVRQEKGEAEATCSACGTTETAEGWARLMGVEVGPLTAEVVCARLLSIGIRTTPNGLRMRVARGGIPASAVSRDARGRLLYDLAQTVTALSGCNDDCNEDEMTAV